MPQKTLYERLGGYDAISAVANDLVSRLQADAQLGRFWQHRGEDGVRREKQLLIDFLCSCAGGPLYYTGRDMKTAHKGMRISESDWSRFLGHLNMARTFVACGTPDQVREWIEPLWRRANSMMIVPPSWGLSPEQLAAKTAAIAETFWTTE
jgi:hemoglobin